MELNSEQNHDDYCLAYVFTDRDFDDGVLGLAWVGAPSGWYTTPNTYIKPWYRLHVFKLGGCLQGLTSDHPVEPYPSYLLH